MLDQPANRLQEYFTPQASAVLNATAMNSMGAFVPYPVFAGLCPAHASFITEVYRLAREMTDAQLRKSVRSFPPAFSMN